MPIVDQFLNFWGIAYFLRNLLGESKILKNFEEFRDYFHLSTSPTPIDPVSLILSTKLSIPTKRLFVFEYFYNIFGSIMAFEKNL